MNRNETIQMAIEGKIREKIREIEYLIKNIIYEMTNEELSGISDQQEYLEELSSIDCVSCIRAAADLEATKIELAQIVADRIVADRMETTDEQE